MALQEVANYLICHLATVYRLLHKTISQPSSWGGAGASSGPTSMSGNAVQHDSPETRVMPVHRRRRGRKAKSDYPPLAFWHLVLQTEE
jgi:hypothetical protein